MSMLTLVNCDFLQARIWTASGLTFRLGYGEAPLSVPRFPASLKLNWRAIQLLIGSKMTVAGSPPIGNRR
jgi:hypothetical protein